MFAKFLQYSNQLVAIENYSPIHKACPSYQYSQQKKESNNVESSKQFGVQENTATVYTTLDSVDNLPT